MKSFGSPPASHAAGARPKPTRQTSAGPGLIDRRRVDERQVSRLGRGHAGKRVQRLDERRSAATVGQAVLDRDDSRPRLGEHHLVVATKRVVRQTHAHGRKPGRNRQRERRRAGRHVHVRAPARPGRAADTLSRRRTGALALLTSVSDTVPPLPSGARVRSAAVMPTFVDRFADAIPTARLRSSASPRAAGGTSLTTMSVPVCPASSRARRRAERQRVMRRLWQSRLRAPSALRRRARPDRPGSTGDRRSARA